MNLHSLNIPSCVAETMLPKFSIYAAKLASLRKLGILYTDTVACRCLTYSVRKSTLYFLGFFGKGDSFFDGR